MILLSIGCSKNSSELFDSLNKICNFFKEKNINIGIYENEIGGMHFIKCILKNTEKDLKAFEENRDTFYSCASNAIYDFIVSEYEMGHVRKILEEDYNYMEDEDLEEVNKRCCSIIRGTGVFTSEGLIYSMGARCGILKKIDDYLKESNEIVLDGFMTFRLKEINEILKDIVDKVVEELVLEREYSEFIKLLKYFVDIQESRYEIVNIFTDINGEFKITDGDLKDITLKIFEDFDFGGIKSDISKEDILISAVITSAPLKIVYHLKEGFRNEDVIDTLRSIFGERFIICEDCDLCRKFSSIVKEK